MTKPIRTVEAPAPYSLTRRGHRAARRRGKDTDRRLEKRFRAGPRLEWLEDRMLLTNFLVNSNADTSTGTNSTTGTLRYVLNQLNSTVGGASNIISFASLPSNELTFTPHSALPTITKKVTIDGSTAPGFSSAPVITISGLSAGLFVNGLTFGTGSSGSTVKDLAIEGFGSGDGFDIQSGSTGDQVAGCWIGGTTNLNHYGGVTAGVLVAGNNATIGGTSPAAANTISGNNDLGISIEAPSCTVEGNYIGTNSAGATVANYGGIDVNFGATGATIGGTASGAANTISGNGLGLELDAPSCAVEGNLIGTNSAGATVANGIGISVFWAGSTIGGTTSAAANVISGNSSEDIQIAASCLVEGNRIGTDASGTAAVPNGTGILVYASGATIGGPAAGNSISGNTHDGVNIEAASALLEGNLIGVSSSGDTALPNNVGVKVGYSGATIGGSANGDTNVISGNTTYGVDIDAYCLVVGNDIGIDAAGAAVPNGVDGIYVAASGETIGGTASGDANTISGNSSYGIDIEATSCTVVGNLIGTNALGTAAVANGTGILINGSGATIGGPAAGNTISGNTNDGVDIEAASALLEGNLIGVSSSGDTAVSNDAGVYDSAAGTTIGGTDPGDANTISGNKIYGIVVNAPSCTLEGNFIGTNSDGTSGVIDNVGILVVAAGVTIGGTDPGDGNVISGNFRGILISGSSCAVEGNLIGTNAAGATVPNNIGIWVYPGGGTGATIGGTVSGDGNTISGNVVNILIEGSSCTVEGNLIGANPAGATGVSRIGIDVSSSGTGATIGGTSSGAANTISGNSHYGIEIEGSSCTVEGNLIGTDSAGATTLGNGTGIYVSATGATIGGTASGAGNVIAFNSGAGVATAPGTTGTTIRFNAIFGNTGPGIDRNDDGVTPNTTGGTYNTPVLASAGDGTIAGTLNAAPNSTYILDFYANPSGDASPARPQGQTDVGTLTVATNAQGNVAFSFPYTPLSLEPFVTATATGASGVTSEFSAPAAYTLSATGLTFQATAGVPFQGEVASFTTSDAVAAESSFTATINWGDGSSSTAGTIVAAPGGFIVVGSHTFTQANPAVPVAVTIDDSLDLTQSTASSLADVSGPSGVLTTYGQTANFVAGTPYAVTLASFTDSNPNAVAGQFTAVITWGDGTSGAGTVSASGAGFVVTGTHTYNFGSASEPGASVVITDHLTGLTATASPTIVVAPVPLTIAPKNFAVTPGTAFTGTVATFTDANPLTSPGFYTATINWGDGTSTSTGTITGTNPFTVSGSHTYTSAAWNTYAEQGTIIVTITITDANGQMATAVARAVNPPDAGTGTGPGTAGTEPTASPVSPTAGTEPATSPVSPTAGPTVALAVEAVSISVARNRVFQGTVATFTDSGPAEPASAYTATIDWGKGRRTAGMILGSNGRFTVSARHLFTKFSGSRPVTVTVTDPDGQSVTVSESASEVVRHPKVIKVASRGRTAAALHL